MDDDAADIRTSIRMECSSFLADPARSQSDLSAEERNAEKASMRTAWERYREFEALQHSGDSPSLVEFIAEWEARWVRWLCVLRSRSVSGLLLELKVAFRIFVFPFLTPKQATSCRNVVLTSHKTW